MARPYYLLIAYKTTDNPQTVKHVQREGGIDPDDLSSGGHDPVHPDHRYYLNRFFQSDYDADEHDHFLESELDRIPMVGDLRIVLPVSGRIRYAHIENTNQEHQTENAAAAALSDGDEITVDDIDLAMDSPEIRSVAWAMLALLRFLDPVQFPYTRILTPARDGTIVTIDNSEKGFRRLLHFLYSRMTRYLIAQNAQVNVNREILLNHQAVLALQRIWKSEDASEASRLKAEDGWIEAVKVVHSYDSEARFDFFRLKEQREVNALHQSGGDEAGQDTNQDTSSPPSEQPPEQPPEQPSQDDNGDTPPDPNKEGTQD